MKNHLLIAGTGRAGTTFLVQYLAECGLDTHLARNQHPGYDEDANAGLEDLLLDNPDAPYVVKSPWLYEYAERLLADREIVVDAVIIPMRSIVEAQPVVPSTSCAQGTATRRCPTIASNGSPGERRRAESSIHSTPSIRRVFLRLASMNFCTRS